MWVIHAESYNMKSMLSKIRWRSKHIRYSQKFMRSIRKRKFDYFISQDDFGSDNYLINGHLKTPDIEINLPREVDPSQPFTDIKRLNSDYMQCLTETVVNLPQISRIKDYFPRGLSLWNVALNYSPARAPSNEVNESQLWHWDYGDTRTVHLMINLEDVDGENGPFTFISHETNKIVKRHPFWIERFTDVQFEALTGKKISLVKEQFTGKKGSFMFVDPGKILHQGARNIKPRLVAFYTFTTQTPFEVNSEFESLKSNDKFWRRIEKNLNGI